MSVRLRSLSTVLPCLVLVIVALAASALPSMSTAAEAESADNLERSVARMSDRDVRNMLLEHMSNASPQPVEEFNPAVIMYRLQRDLGRLGTQLDGIFAATRDLPEIFPRAWKNFNADREDGGLLHFVVGTAVSMLAGAAVALGLRRRVSKLLPNAEDDGEYRLRRKIGTLLVRLLARGAYIALFCIVATLIYISVFDDSSKDRVAFFFYLAATGIFLTSIALSSAFHSPRHPALRLPLYSDDEARHLHRAALLTVGFGAFAFFTCALMGTLGVVGEVHELFLILVGASTTALLVRAILTGRKAITHDISSGSSAGSVREAVARLWPTLFATAVVLLLIALVVRELLYDFVPYGAALFTIAVMALAPSLDAFLYRHARDSSDSNDALNSAALRAGRLALLALIVASLCAAWRINPFASDAGLGGDIAAGALQVSLTLLVAYAFWQLARIFIDRKIAEEDKQLASMGIDPSEMEIGGEGLSRMRTLLPLLKRSVQITLLVMVTMIVLGALGVDIAPLLAGAGVVGLAIGFGSQTLVRDIVSGAFFLVDDAFRIGEYIDVGGVMGTVEKMSVRSVRLRHHRGAVHTVPFGEVKTLTNYSRDWAIMKLKICVPFDTDVDRVRKIIKKTGLELAENEEIKDDFLQPFKSQGVTEVSDYGFIISTKFMSKPGKQFVIRRYAFAAIQKAFEENGIEFAMPRVEVSMGDMEEADDTPTPARQRRNEIALGAAATHPVVTTVQSSGE